MSVSLCVCVRATPAGLPTRHGSIRDQRPPFSSLPPLLHSAPSLQAQRVLNLKSKAQRALSQHAPFAAGVSSPPLPLGTWLKATRISVSGLFLQPSATSASPLRPSATFCLRNCAISLASCEFSLPQTTASAAAASIVQIASAIRPQVTQL